MGLFGKDPKRDPKEMVREWSSNTRKEGRKLDREIRGIQRKEAEIVKSLKASAKKGDKDVCVILAKEVIHARKAVNKLYAAKAQLNSIDLSMKNQLATLRISGALEKSTQVMKGMSQLIKIPEIQATMMEMSKEMMKAGLIEEMLEDTFEGMEDQDELEEDAQKEVEKVLFDLTSGILGQAPAAVADSLPEGATAGPSMEGEGDEDIGDMQARLEALRS